MNQQTLVARDEQGDSVFVLRAAGPDELPGHVVIEVGLFRLVVSGAIAAEVGRQFLSASVVALNQKAAA